MDAILGEVTIRQRRKRLDEMTQGNSLGDAYTATLARLKAQKGFKSVLGLKVLMWVLYSERPLRAQELCHALGVELGSPDLDPENIPALRTLLASCLGLVTVEASSSTVRLVHFTLQEYLSRDPALFYSPHSTITEVCLTYLNFESVRDLSPIARRAPATMPLLEYASVYWGRHARREMTANNQILALRLLDRFDEHISAQLLLLHRNQSLDVSYPMFPEKVGPLGFTGLHGASFLGIPAMVSAVLEMKEGDVNAEDCMGMMALTWASLRGHEDVVKILLEREDINPDRKDTKSGWTPLSRAAADGQERVVKVLLQREDVNPNQSGTKYGATPLSFAAEGGHQGVVKMLLEREDVSPDQADAGDGRTPLSWAAEGGHEGVAKMLLERNDVCATTPDKRNLTPLLWALSKRHHEVARILRERDNVNSKAVDC